MAKIIDFNEFKTKQMHKNSLNFRSLGKTNEIFDLDLDLSAEWANTEDENNSNLNTTFYKLCKSILISIKKCLTLKVLKIEHRFDSIISEDENCTINLSHKKI